jgi:hypothetical protein
VIDVATLAFVGPMALVAVALPLAYVLIEGSGSATDTEEVTDRGTKKTETRRSGGIRFLTDSEAVALSVSLTIRTLGVCATIFAAFYFGYNSLRWVMVPKAIIAAAPCPTPEQLEACAKPTGSPTVPPLAELAKASEAEAQVQPVVVEAVPPPPILLAVDEFSGNRSLYRPKPRQIYGRNRGKPKSKDRPKPKGTQYAGGVERLAPDGKPCRNPVAGNGCDPIGGWPSKPIEDRPHMMGGVVSRSP